MPTRDRHEQRAFEAERKRQLDAAKVELADVLRTAQKLQRDLNDGSTALASGGRRLANSAALLLERLAALDALENVSYLTSDGED